MKVRKSFVSLSITVKELKALLPLLNYKVPSSRALKDKFQVWVVVSQRLTLPNRARLRKEQLLTASLVYALRLQAVGSKKDCLDFEQFHKLYNHIMFEQNGVSLKTDPNRTESESLCAFGKSEFQPVISTNMILVAFLGGHNNSSLCFYKDKSHK